MPCRTHARTVDLTMPWNPIIKSRRDWDVIPNLHDYEAVRNAFSWEKARADLDGLPGGTGLNIAHEAVVRHATGPQAQQTAIRWLGKTGTVEDYSYERLHDLTNRFANALQGLGSHREIGFSSSPAAFLSCTSQHWAH